MKPIAILGALALASALAGCATTGQLTANEIQTIDQAIAIGCPIVTAVQASTIRLTAAQTQALSLMALACPPNPPPTSAAVAVVDLVEAIAILQPLVAK